MKKIFVSMFALACIFGAQNASSAPVDDVMKTATCSPSVTVDSGHSAVNGNTTTNCTCSDRISGCTGGLYSGSCPSGWGGFGTTVTGYKCCAHLCQRQPETLPQTTVEGSDDEGLQNVFDSRVPVYFGVVDLLSRSPNFGRNLIIEAKLDVCLGDANVDALPVNYPNDPYGAWSACTGASYCGSTLKNAYCRANSAQVCNDRCNCKYRSPLIAAGYADPGCSNL